GRLPRARWPCNARCPEARSRSTRPPGARQARRGGRRRPRSSVRTPAESSAEVGPDTLSCVEATSSAERRQCPKSETPPPLFEWSSLDRCASVRYSLDDKGVTSERRRLGRTEIVASVLGFGGAEIGYQRVSGRTVD